MATVGLAVIGNVIGSAIFGEAMLVGTISAAAATTAVFATAGSYIDATYVLPHIMDKPESQGPRLDDLRIQTASEGSALMRCFGPECRVAGTIIWMSPVREVQHETSMGGGKGGGGGSQVTWTYNVDIAIAICDTTTLPDGAIADVTEIWADRAPLYGEQDRALTTSSSFWRVRKKVYAGTTRMFLESDTSTGGPDLKSLGIASGQDIAISGFTGALTPNNGTFHVKKVKLMTHVNEVQTIQLTGSPTGGYFQLSFDSNWTSYIPIHFTASQVKQLLVALSGFKYADLTVTGTLAAGMTIEFGGQHKGIDVALFVLENDQIVGGSLSITETTKGWRRTSLRVLNDDVVTDSGPLTDTITIDQTPRDFSEGRADEVRIFTGVDTQSPDSLIESFEGTAPAYRGTAYVIIENLRLRRYGNRIPQFEFLVVEAATRTLGEVVGSILESAGFESGDYDTSALTENIRGLVFSSDTTPARILEQLILAYDLAVRESGGKLVWYYRGTEDSIEIDADHLAARQGGSVITPAKEMEDSSSFVMPSEVSVRYVDRDNNWQSGSQKERRLEFDIIHVQQFEFPITWAANEARDVAARLLFEPSQMRNPLSITLPPQYLHAEAGDLLEFTHNGEEYTLRMTEVERGNNFLLAVDGFREVRTLLEWNSPDDPPFGGNDDDEDPDVYVPSDTTLLVLDIPALNSTHASQPGYYIACSNTERNESWQGVTLFRSLTGIDNYNEILSIDGEVTTGEAETALADGPVEYWDRENTVDIFLYHGDLSSSTMIDVLNGVNHIIIGDEIVGVVDIEQIGVDQYRCSTLLRGIANTPTDTHAADEEIALVSSSRLLWVDANLSDIGGTFDFWAVPSEAQVADWPISDQLTFTGSSMTSFPPCHIRGVRDGSNNLVVTWDRVSRDVVDIFAETGVSLVEGTETYEIDVAGSAGGDVVATYTVNDTTTWTYTAAQQDTDFGTSGGKVPVFVTIHQIDPQTNRGHASEEREL